MDSRPRFCLPHCHSVLAPESSVSISPGSLMCLFYYIILKNNAVKKVFSYKFIPIIGGMCYSIYLLHYAIISFLGRHTIHFHVTDYYLPHLLLQIILIG